MDLPPFPLTKKAVKTTWLYGTESVDILHAEVFIAERKYKQLLAIACSYRTHVFQAKQKLKISTKDFIKFNDCMNGYGSKATR
jgi:hypothetical protein